MGETYDHIVSIAENCVLACIWGQRAIKATRRMLSAYTAWVPCALRKICVIVVVANYCPRNVDNGMPDKFALAMCINEAFVHTTRLGLRRRKNILLLMPE